MAERWRVGGKLKRTLYRDEQLVGLVDTGEIAAEIVETMNRVGRLLDEVRGETARERSLEEIIDATVVHCPTCVALVSKGRFDSTGRHPRVGELCAGIGPRDAERRSEATPQIAVDLSPETFCTRYSGDCRGCGCVLHSGHDGPCDVHCGQRDGIRRWWHDQRQLSRVDPYDTKKGFTP